METKPKKPFTIIIVILTITVAALAISVGFPLLEIWVVNQFIEQPVEYSIPMMASFAVGNGLLLFMYFLLSTSKITKENDTINKGPSGKMEK